MHTRKALLFLAALFKSKMSDAATEVDLIVSGVEAAVGYVTVQPPSPSGEATPFSNIVQDTTADVGGNYGSVRSATNQAESNVAPDVKMILISRFISQRQLDSNRL